MVEEYCKNREQRRDTTPAHSNQQQQQQQQQQQEEQQKASQLPQPSLATPDAGAKRKRIQPQLISAAALPSTAVQPCSQHTAPLVSAPLEPACFSSVTPEIDTGIQYHTPVCITVVRVTGASLQVCPSGTVC